MKGKIFVLAALGIILLGSGAWAQETKVFEIKAKKFQYTPNIIRVNKGDTVRFSLISEDVHHGLYLDGYNIRTSAYPGKDGGFSFVADKSGRFNFRCSVTCGEFHPYMVGYLIVSPNSRLYFYSILAVILGLGSLLLIYRKAKGSEHVSG